jgi:phospholipid transport system substrate-binding protein
VDGFGNQQAWRWIVPSSWKTFGRTVEITTIALLVLAVGYLWVNSDSDDTEAHQVPSQAPDAKTETVQQPHRPPMSTATDAGTDRRPAKVSPPIEVSPPADLYQPPYESPPDYGLAGEMRPCGADDQFAPAVQAEGMMPQEVVEQAIWRIQADLRSSQDNYADNSEQLYDLFYEKLLPIFDMRFAGTSVLGKHWRTATAGQKDRFDCAFQIILIKRLATDLLECYQGELAILPFRGDAAKRTTTVKTNCQLIDGSSISVHYTLVNRENQWRIFDVTIEGVSYVRNYRAELDAEIRNSSLEEVIQRLEKDAEISLGEG